MSNLTTIDRFMLGLVDACMVLLVGIGVLWAVGG